MTLLSRDRHNQHTHWRAQWGQVRPVRALGTVPFDARVSMDSVSDCWDETGGGPYRLQWHSLHDS
jgi:hypothetical protein